MAFRTDPALAEAYADLKKQSRSLKSVGNSAIVQLVATVDVNAIIGWAYSFKTLRDNIVTLAGTPGLAQYAKDQEDDQLYDVVAEYVAMRDAADAVITWVQTNMPTDGSGYILGWKFAATQLDPRTFNTTVTAPLKTLIQTTVDAIA